MTDRQKKATASNRASIVLNRLPFALCVKIRYTLYTCLHLRPHPYGITVKIVPIPAVLTRYPSPPPRDYCGNPAVPITVQLATPGQSAGPGSYRPRSSHSVPTHVVPVPRAATSKSPRRRRTSHSSSFLNCSCRVLSRNSSRLMSRSWFLSTSFITCSLIRFISS